MTAPVRVGPPRLDPACRIETALRRLGDGREVLVARAGRIAGRIDRRLLERAAGYGLGSLRLASLITDPPAPPPGTGGSVHLGSRMAAGLKGEELDRLRALGRAASARGVRACLVGGTVRDLLLGTPLRDLDVVTVGGGARLVAGLARELGGTARRHARFGTATIAFPDGSRLDLASARRESYAHPAALPQVGAGTLEEDLERRDFSINAMAVELAPRRFGRLVDPLGGEADLRAGRLRVLHGLSFIEDPTRAFRAVRLVARLGLRLAPRSARLIEIARARGLFDLLSAARLRQAVVLLLEEERVARAASLAARLRLWETLQPGLRPGAERRRELRDVQRIWREHGGWAGKAGARRWVVGLGLLLVELEPRAREALLVRLGAPRRAAAALRAAVPESDRILATLSRERLLRPSRLHRCCRKLPLEILLLAAARAPAAVQRRAVLAYAAHGRRERADIRGSDLLRAGVPPGPRVAAGLEAALEAKLDGRARSKARQLAVALRAAART